MLEKIQLKLTQTTQSLGRHKRHGHLLLLACFVASMAIPYWTLRNQQVQAIYPYTASSVIGQLDGNGQNSYTRSSFTAPPANNVGLHEPEGVVTDTVNHRLFISDYRNSRIMVYNLDSSNQLLNYEADYVLGQADFTILSSHPTTQNTFGSFGLDFDQNRQWLFVSDGDNSRVLIFDTSSGISNNMNASYVLGASDFTTGGGGVTQSTFDCAFDVDFNSNNNYLFVVDSCNARVLVFDTTTVTNGMNAINVLGQTLFTTSNTNVTQSGMVWPNGISYDEVNDRLFVGDNSAYRVTIYDLSGGITNGMNASNVLGQPDFTTSDYSSPGDQNSMSIVNDVAYDANHDRLYVADSDNSRIMVYNFSGGITDNMNASYVLGQPNFTSATYGNPPTAANMTVIEDIVYDDATDQFFVQDLYNNRVLIFDGTNISNGMNASDVIGQNLTPSLPSFTTNNAQNLHYFDSEIIGSPSGMAIDSVNHRLFVSDPDHGRVKVYNLNNSNQLLDNFADNVLGQASFAVRSFSVDNATMYSPAGLVYDEANQRLFVADLDYNRILVFDLSGGVTDGMAASNVIGQSDFISSAYNTTQDGLGNPQGLSYGSSAQRLFVADASNYRVLVYDLSGGITNGMNASNVLGQPDFVTATGATNQNTLWNPTGLAFDGDHDRLYVADNYNTRVIIYDLSGGITDGMNGAYVLGADDFVGNFTYNSAADIPSPNGVYYDSAHSLVYVSSGYPTDRVLVFDVSAGLTNGMSASDVIGQPDFDTYDYSSDPVAQNNFDNPTAMLYLPTIDTMLIADTGDNRIMSYVLGLSGGDSTPPSVPVGLNQTGSTTTTISLAWNASTDNIGVTGYRLYRNAVQIGSPSSTNYTDSGLTAGTTYTYTVSAVDAATNQSAQSAGVLASTTSNGSSSPPSATPPASSSPKPKAPIKSDAGPTIIDLDNQTTFVDGSGYENTAGTAQKYQFSTGSGISLATHTVTLTSILASSISFEIDGQGGSLGTGQLTSWDVDNDSKNDISIELVGLSGSNATIRFYKVLPPVATTTTKPDTKPLPLVSPAQAGGLASPSYLERLNGYLPPTLVAAFPWLLFLILLMIILRLAQQAWNESRALKLLEQTLAKEKSLSEEKSNFINLGSHYLRTPLTIISGAVDLIGSIQPGLALDDLKKYTVQLKTAVDDILKHSSLLLVEQLPNQASSIIILPTKKLLTNAHFILPISITSVLVVLADYIYINVKDLNMGTLTLLLQAAALLLLSVSLMAMLRMREIRRTQRLNQDTLLQRQRQLESERSQLILSAVANLEKPLDKVRSEIDKLQAEPKLTKSAYSGLNQFEDTLDKFKIAAGLKSVGISSSKQKLELSTITTKLEADHAQDLAAKHLQLNVDLTVSSLAQDRTLLASVLDSLLDNAIKYSPENSQITITSKYLGKDKVEITVNDSGPGVPAGKLDQLFKPFSRAEDAARDFNRQGIGLSLYIDRLIMRYLGGDITLQTATSGGTQAKLVIETA